MKNFNLIAIDKNVAELIFNMPREKVNKLSIKALKELDENLDEIIKSNYQTIIIKSTKEGIFIAGADIKEIESMKNHDDVIKLLNNGNKVFNKLASLKQTTIALIEGACMGGGLELALSCDFRVAIESIKTKLALPEVKLGIIPGLGGTQRLPRLIGLKNSLGMILAGSIVDSKKAFRLGLVDLVIPKGYEKFDFYKFVNSINTYEVRKKILAQRKSKKFIESFSFVRNFMYKKTNESLLKKTKGFYPAPLSALEVIKNTWNLPLDEGLKIESEAFSKLVLGNISKNLISLFFATEAVKSQKFDAKPKEIKNSAVVGAGVMGKGIIWYFSNNKTNVRVKLREIKQIGEIIKSVKKTYDFLIKRKKQTSHDVSFKLNSITYTDKFDGLQNVDLALEAVIEDEIEKQKVYKNLESKLPNDAIIATNTSSISISSLAKSLTCKENFVGIHFFNPVDRMPLVEIIPSKQTSEQTLSTIYDYIKKSGKTPIIVQDCAGFLVNRILIPYVNEALHMVDEGIDIETIDKALTDFGMPLGPIELLDSVGIDVGYKVLNILHNAYGDRMEPSPIIEPIITGLQILGKKNGKGFYIYGENGKTVNKELSYYIGESTTIETKEIVQRCIFTMINEASRCLEEQIVAKPSQLDLAMIMGTGFPPFRGGLLKYADSLKISTLQNGLTKYKDKYGSRFEPSNLITKLSNNNGKFY